MSKVLVGLLDFDALHIRSGVADRLLHLSKSVEKTREMSSKLGITPAAGKLKSIFIAPEFMFIREQNETKNAGRAMTSDQRKEIRMGFDQIATVSPSMLMVPGSIVFKVNTVAAGRKAIANLQNAIKPGEFVDPITSRKAGVGKYERPTLPTFEAAGKGLEPAQLYAEQIKKLEEVTSVEADKLVTQPSMLQNHFLIKNRADVYFDGKKILSYGKKNNAGERVDDDEVDNSIFIPGKKEGVATIDSKRVGFEICADHSGGVLSKTLDNPSSLDLHIICSGWVDNREFTKNLCVREGGYCLHASTDSKMTTVLQKLKGAKSTGDGIDLADEAKNPLNPFESKMRRDRFLKDQAKYLYGWRPVDPIASTDVGLSTIRFYLIDLAPPIVAPTISLPSGPTGGGLRGGLPPRGGRIK